MFRESRPSEKVRVVSRFAWGNEVYEHDWLELDLTGSELRSRVAAAEAAGLGISDPTTSTSNFRHLAASGYCHEADIHVTAADPRHPYVEAERQRWLEMGWAVYPCADT